MLRLSLVPLLFCALLFSNAEVVGGDSPTSLPSPTSSSTNSASFSRDSTPSVGKTTASISASARVTRAASKSQAPSFATFTPNETNAATSSSVVTASVTPSNSRTPSKSPTTSSTLSLSPTPSNSATSTVSASSTATLTPTSTLWTRSQAKFSFSVLLGQYENASGAFGLISPTSRLAYSLAYALARGLGINGSTEVEVISLRQTTVTHYGRRLAAPPTDGKDPDRQLSNVIVTSSFTVVGVNAAAVAAQGLLGSAPPSLDSPSGIAAALLLFNALVESSTGAMLGAISADQGLIVSLGGSEISQLYVKPVGPATFLLAASYSATPTSSPFIGVLPSSVGTAESWVWGVVVGCAFFTTIFFGWVAYFYFFHACCDRMSAEHTLQAGKPDPEQSHWILFNWISVRVRARGEDIRVIELPPEPATIAHEIDLTIDVDDDVEMIVGDSFTSVTLDRDKVGTVSDFVTAGVGYIPPQKRAQRSAAARPSRVSRALRGAPPLTERDNLASPVKVTRSALLALAGDHKGGLPPLPRSTSTSRSTSPRLTISF